MPASEPRQSVADERGDIEYSVVIPVYKNEASLEKVVSRLTAVASRLDGRLEAVFVVDGSPDGSATELGRLLPDAAIASQLVLHSRNFGSFSAIRTGLGAARGRYIGVMAADLQEPPELMEQFFARLAAGDVDVVVGKRESRADPGMSAMFSTVFWGLYRRVINRELPQGGVDVFGCTRAVARRLVELEESHSSLVGQLYWLGYRRAEVPYSRQERTEGTSAWTFRKRVRYLLDSVFAFTSIPISMLIWVGLLGALVTVIVGVVVAVSWATGRITEVGYTPLMLVILFSTFTMLLGLGVVGSYVWRTYENSKARPTAITMRHEVFDGHV